MTGRKRLMLAFAAMSAAAAVVSSIVFVTQAVSNDDPPAAAPQATPNASGAVEKPLGTSEPAQLTVQIAGGPVLKGLSATVTVPGVRLEGRTAFAYQRNQNGQKWYRHNCVDDPSGIICKDVRFGDDQTAKATYDVRVVIVDEAGRKKLIESTQSQSFVTVDPATLVPPVALRAVGGTHAERPQS